MRTFFLFATCATAVFAAATAFAQERADPVEFQDDVPIEVYLSVLSQVAPPAREGAEAYMAAFKQRCGRTLRTVELRRAFAEGNGDPILMAMVRASQQRDMAASQRLAAQIACSRS